MIGRATALVNSIVFTYNYNNNYKYTHISTHILELTSTVNQEKNDFLILGDVKNEQMYFQ